MHWAVEPQPLILDEPVSALNGSVQAQVLNLLDDIQARVQMAYLFISHDRAAVRQVCTDAVVMRNGQIVESEPVAAILDDPKHEYTKALRRSVVAYAGQSARSANELPPSKRAGRPVASRSHK